MVIAALATVGLLACAGPEKAQSDELDSILRDGDLTLMSSHALTAPVMSPAPIPVPIPGVDGGVGAMGGGAPPPVDAGGPGGRGGAPAVDGGPGGGPGGTGGSMSFDGGPGGRGGVGGMGAVGGGKGGAGGIFPEQAQGLWQFDDCVAERTELRDSTFQGHTAFRSVSAACVAGRQGTGVAIDGAEDYVYVPDQPSFTFANGVTVAAWVRPTTLGDVRTIFRKREGGTSTFVLLSNGRDYQFVIRLAGGRAASVKVSAALNAWSHVAGTYDGTELRLYLNGALAAHTRVSGPLSEGAGPLLMGNDAFGRRLDGVLDSVFFDTTAATADQIARLTCVTQPPSLLAVPSAGPLVAPGTRVDFDVQVKNNDSPTCVARAFTFQSFGQAAGISTTPVFASLPPVVAGAVGHLTLSVSSDLDQEPDDYAVPFFVSQNTPPFDFLNGSVTYSVKGGPCSVRTKRELMITDLSVVEDPVRTAPGGAWTFDRLMQNLAPTAAEAPRMVEKMLSTWLTDQTVNGQVIPARPAMQDLVLSSFPRTATGELDLGRAPVRLLAIVNRIDLRDLSQGNAGEGRFVFGVLDANGSPTQFTMIFEYKIPASTAQDVTDSANRWHALGALTVPSDAYNTALQALTDGFTNRGAAPGRVNGSALSQFRTNEIALSFIWQFREFHLSSATGDLEPAPLALTPSLAFNRSALLTDYINANESSIVLEQHVVPETFEGQPFLTGSVVNDLGGWDVQGAVNPEARQKFSVNTCNGCHSTRETNTTFLQINPRGSGQETSLSAFLTGTSVFDRQAGVIRSFNDLQRRNRDLHVLICPNDPLPPAPPPTTGVGGRGGGTGGAGGVGGAAGAAGGVGGGAGGATGGGVGGGGVPTPVPTPAIGGSGVSGGFLGQSAATVDSFSGVPVIDESAVVARPDFVVKGINRAD